MSDTRPDAATLATIAANEARRLALSTAIAKLNATIDALGTIDPVLPSISAALDRATRWVSEASGQAARALEIVQRDALKRADLAAVPAEHR